MFYVYLLKSDSVPGRRNGGFSKDLRSRVAAHNAGKARHTSKYRPWTLDAYFAFSDETRARQFEAYLKTASGKAFAGKRLWSE